MAFCLETLFILFDILLNMHEIVESFHNLYPHFLSDCIDNRI